MTLRHWKMPEDGEEFPCLLCDSPLGGYYDALCHVADNHCKERLAMTITVRAATRLCRIDACAVLPLVCSR